jgi:peptide-methionine (S)-S-oxide reductase
VTEVKRLEAFYPAEEYHQKYYWKKPRSAYRRLVIAPKLAKLSQEFGHRVVERPAVAEGS